MQNVIKIYYVGKSYEHFHELRTDGRTQLVIIVLRWDLRAYMLHWLGAGVTRFSQRKYLALENDEEELVQIM